VEPGHALVHELAATVEVDAGPHVFMLVNAHAHPENEATVGEVLEGGGLLGHDGGRTERQLQDTRPKSGRLVVTAATASVVKASAMGCGQ